MRERERERDGERTIEVIEKCAKTNDVRSLGSKGGTEGARAAIPEVVVHFWLLVRLCTKQSSVYLTSLLTVGCVCVCVGVRG